MGYSFLVIYVTGLVDTTIPLVTVIGLVFFFGSLFTFVTLSSIKSTLTSILGSTLSDEEAIKLFRSYAGIDDDIDLTKVYTFSCDHCNQDVSYTIADVVRSSTAVLERGIVIESVFGVKSYILHPQHQCKDGRRELIIINPCGK